MSLKYCRLSLRFSLISASVSSEMGWLSRRPHLDCGMALSTAVLIAVVLKSAYLSISWVDLSSGTSPELSAASRVDSNTSRSVWLNLYLTGFMCMFLWGCVSIAISMGRWSLPKSSPIRNCMSCSDKFDDVNAMSRMSVLPVYLSRCVCSSVFK